MPAQKPWSLTSQPATKSHTPHTTIWSDYNTLLQYTVTNGYLWTSWALDHRGVSHAPRLERTFSSQGHITEHKPQSPIGSLISLKATGSLVTTLGWVKQKLPVCDPHVIVSPGQFRKTGILCQRATVMGFKDMKGTIYSQHEQRCYFKWSSSALCAVWQDLTNDNYQ